MSVHAGDFTMTGDLGSVRAFGAWVRALPHRRLAGGATLATRARIEFCHAELLRLSHPELIESPP